MILFQKIYVYLLNFKHGLSVFITIIIIIIIFLLFLIFVIAQDESLH